MEQFEGIRADTVAHRLRLVKALNSKLPAGFDVTHEGPSVFANRRWESAVEHGRFWERVACSYGRTVVRFAYESQSNSMETKRITVGDAGVGSGWCERLVELFLRAIEEWAAYQKGRGWPT